MLRALILPLIFAIISPFLWGFMNVLDKYVVSYKVKNPLSFAPVSALVNLIFGIILALFLKWQVSSFSSILFPAIAGILLGSQYFFYYLIMKKEDAPNFIGFMYVYPLLVALLSFLFLNEKLSLIGYIGVIFILAGAVFLSIKRKNTKIKAAGWMLCVMIVVGAFYEFFVKVSTNNISGFNGLAVNLVFMGLTVLTLLFNKNVRTGFKREFKNIKWSLLSEFFTFTGILTLYLAMAKLPATIVSSVATLQPLAVILFEKIFHRRFKKIVSEASLAKKIIPIIMIVLGIILLYLPEILKI
jgi:transporter family protein